MNTNTTGNNTMNSVAKSGKKVAKKSDTVAATPVAATPVAAAAPVAAAKAPRVKKEKVAEVVAVAAAVDAAPAASAAPEAQAVSVPVSVSTVGEELQSLIASLTSIRDAAAKAIHGAKTLEKKVARELKQASRRRRNRRSEVTEGGEVREKRPSVFTTPFTLKDSLCAFLGKPAGTQMSPANVFRAFKVYIDTHSLKGEKHKIIPDSAMCNVLGIQASDDLNYKNIQKYLYKLYDLKSAVKTA
jgi:hypothetical protein